VAGGVGHISHPLHYLPPVASQDAAGLGWLGLFGHPGSDTFQPEPTVPYQPSPHSRCDCSSRSNCSGPYPRAPPPSPRLLFC
jgi:hypothetical protein